ncbi:GntR family transcriptional regulator [Abyssibius alkaniclasticus]|mgnify:CR=1 FL=1|uniref:GntR family transcriptional regulator n=1 Tax=Abyssibius alkaniclasticus TaxID=2881234 RepID=UPI002363339A|nr:GntR family transcriptional regulator [Abyssibius alkaniclasticus]UPH71723.1 GntR family transcriptional regulator [Abyssibius alkaniclasticus]
MIRPRPIQTDLVLPAHEVLYRALRTRIMHGEMEPGESLTLRGIAAAHGVSMTPAREAVRRLVAEGALKMTQSGRVSTPELSNERIEELASLRALLEPELAARALPRAHAALIERMSAINATVDQMIVKADSTGYVRTNLEFHRLLYLRAQAPAMLALTETVWLQAGPTMRALYQRLRRRQGSEHHRTILACLRAGDEPGLRLAVRADVTNGLRMLLA